MHNQERTDGLTQRQELSLTRRVLREKKKLKMWDTDREMSDGRTIMENCVDLVERVISDDRNSPSTQMFAVDLVLKMQNQNIVLQRMEEEAGAAEEGGGQVIVILPPNGTEKKTIDGEVDDEDLEGEED
jgi:hypothetical protein